MDRSVRRNNTDPSYISKSSSRRSDESYGSQSTAPTSLYISPRPSLQHATTADARHRYAKYYEKASPVTSNHARSSSSTFASTTDNLYAEPEEYDDVEYQMPDKRPQYAVSNTRASTPHDFAEYFPSQRRLDIRHDDTTDDGNMNLRVDTEVTEGGYRTRVQLFHLRMHDLQARQFSLRRYCRDSGREVCHASQRYQKPSSEKPGIHRSMSNALSSLRARPEFKRTNSGGSLKSSPQRADSGYGSDDDQDDTDSFMSSSQSSKSSSSSSSRSINRIKLEFSNYAQVEVRRRGAKRNKRYEFEFWGHRYVWKRMSTQAGAGKCISFHLLRADTGHSIAHLCPELRSSKQMRAEEEAGGWIPPCSMWISDREVLSAMTDVADVIVATGLMALADDCIERHFRPKKNHKRQISVPLTPLKMEYVGPKALVEHVFRRRNSADDAKEKAKERDGHGQAHGQSPLRRQIAAY